MNTRRRFMNLLLRLLTGGALLFDPIVTLIRSAYAQSKRIVLEKGTKMTSLVDKNPATLDTRKLEVIPLEDFGTMGLTDHEVDLNTWRLEVIGEVKKPLRLSYSELLALPSFERKVLLICPGFFSNHGRWKGISVAALLEMAEAEPGITHVGFRGPDGRYERVERFAMEEIVSSKVFLAYQVNGTPLPRKHGFPLRAVAEDHYGSEWVKFVYQVEAHKMEGQPNV